MNMIKRRVKFLRLNIRNLLPKSAETPGKRDVHTFKISVGNNIEKKVELRTDGLGASCGTLLSSLRLQSCIE